MPVPPAQRAAIEDVIQVLTTAKAKGKRVLADMFMVLVDRNEWPEYYEVIPEPRCLENIKASLTRNRYKDPLNVYTDLSLVFWNALFYNEAGSQIAKDAEALKALLESEWRKRTVLPPPRATSPPPTSPQKAHKAAVEKVDPTPIVEVISIPITAPAPALAAKAPTPAPAPTASMTATFTINSDAATPAPDTKPAMSVLNPSVPVRATSPDQDGEGSDDGPDESIAGMDVDEPRDTQSDEIVRQLERSLPRWPGFGDQGWLERPLNYIEIVHAIKSHKDVVGNRLAVALEAVPEQPSTSTMGPISLKQIEARARANQYQVPKDFDIDMAYLFEKGRRWHPQRSEAYGRVLLLQRLYQALTSPNPPAGPPYTSSTNFASLRAGPGNVRAVNATESDGTPNVTTYRVPTRERIFVEEYHYKGWSVRMGDWLHLSNPDDPSRPIIGQVFRCWRSESEGNRGVTVSWYYRPEQTFHPAARKFWENEVFKTSHFAEHPLEDIIEKVACQFTARHIRGRPRAPHWYPGFPLYVCDSRYNDRERIFVRIKNWASCIPEELRRNTEFMPIYQFERAVYPHRHPSPFLSKKASTGATLPGGIIEGDGDGDLGPTKGRLVGENGVAVHSGPAATAATTVQPSVTPVQPLYQQYQQYQTVQQQQVTAPPKPAVDRSITSIAGGPASGTQVITEPIPSEITKCFDRDPETNELLWFPGAPVNAPPTPKPSYSLTYLQFLAKKRKQEMEGGDNRAKKARTVLPTVNETLRDVLKEMGSI